MGAAICHDDDQRSGSLHLSVVGDVWFWDFGTIAFMLKAKVFVIVKQSYQQLL